MNADLFFRTRTTRRTQTCADFFIWIEKINLRSSACSASSACFFLHCLRAFFRVVRVFFLFGARWRFRGFGKLAAACGNVSEGSEILPRLAGTFPRVRKARRGLRERFRGFGKPAAARGNVSEGSEAFLRLAGTFPRVRKGRRTTSERSNVCNRWWSEATPSDDTPPPVEPRRGSTPPLDVRPLRGRVGSGGGHGFRGCRFAPPAVKQSGTVSPSDAGAGAVCRMKL